MISLLLASSLSIEFIGPCSVGPLLKTNVEQGPARTVGAATIATLEKFEIDYQGTEAGLNSAFGTPVGMDAMEVISDTEMRSYGWCYQVDGSIPEAFPNGIPLASVQHEIRWFYAYAHYLNGEWVSQCEPAYKLRPAILCGNL